MKTIETIRPKDGYELLESMQQNKQCEVVDSYAFVAAKMLEENLGRSFSFKLSAINKGWTLLKLS